MMTREEVKEVGGDGMTKEHIVRISSLAHAADATVHERLYKCSCGNDTFDRVWKLYIETRYDEIPSVFPQPVFICTSCGRSHVGVHRLWDRKDGFIDILKERLARE